MTVVEYLACALNAPENQAGVKKFEQFCGDLFDAFNELRAQIEKQTAELPPSLSYEPWLRRRGTTATATRLMARVLVGHGSASKPKKILQEAPKLVTFLQP